MSSMKTTNDNDQREMRLDDESRVKVLSPSMLVLKRFSRNRLAITGLVILIAMFIFSFVGAWIIPYTQTQVFYKYEAMMKDYASVTVNDELRYTVADGETFSLAARVEFIMAVNRGRTSFEADGTTYTLSPIGEADDAYRIAAGQTLATALGIKGKYAYTTVGDDPLSEGVTAAFEAAMDAGEASFQWDGNSYAIISAGKSVTITGVADVALASMRVLDIYEAEDELVAGSLPFRMALEEAIAGGASGFSLDGVDYQVEWDGDAATVYETVDGAQKPFAISSALITSAIAPDVRLSVPFKDAVQDAISARQNSFVFADADGTEIDYAISQTGNAYTIKREAVTQMIDIFAAPSKAHPLGTDANGMDMLTRLMYGGRISLMVGFVVVFIELLIGIIIGGVAGYFGGWIDTLLMRFIDLFNCIPYYPMMIITGSVMDKLDVAPIARIFILMLIMGLLNWTSIARVVRGQILSLREQEFMIATEATGIPVGRRIFRHLVPNVMPLLIVQGTMSLGSVIIAEATLSFLGIGLKYPMASWGTIINAATDMFVMRSYWWIWIPAGSLILITVLGFNFVGDGLRDAFDPKMKR